MNHEIEKPPGEGEAKPGGASNAQEQLTTAEGANQSEGETFTMGAIKRGVVDIPEVMEYAKRLGAVHRGMKKLAVIEQVGKYQRDLAVIRFSDDGEILDPPEGYAPSEAEQAAILAVWKRYTWPEYQPMLCTARTHSHDPSRFPFQRSPSDALYEYWDEKHEHLEMVEERWDNEDGTKDFYIWTHWSDKTWRIAEPDQLPLYNKHLLKGVSTVFLHEGAKAARAVQRLIEDDGEYVAGEAARVGGWSDHPWGETLRGSRLGAVAHLGWTGGAKRAYATDFSPLRRSGARIIVVADNDRNGIDAVRDISRQSRLKMEAVIFNDEWPDGFDLADKIPAEHAEKKTRLEDLLSPATWVTDTIYTGRRPSHVIRSEAIAEWLWTISPPLFFHSASPGRGYSDTEVDAMLRPFSDAEMTARLIRQNLSARADGVAYLPGEKRVLSRDGRRKVNKWVPPRLQEKEGSAWPFARMIVSRFPDRDDRRPLLKWGATLRAVPTTRMEYAILLQSETQGTGKTTLGSIAAQMVGEDNVSRPNESDLTEGQFNSHFAAKRLAIVDEIYSGHSRKTVNKLKSPITDTKLRVNEKYQAPYEMENWIHFIFSSNDLIALLIDNTDRRFFVPRMAETKLSPAFWRAFHEWLKGDGLGIIARCAREWVEKHGAVRPGEAAPMTRAKAEMIDSSVSDAMRLARETAKDLVERSAQDGQRIAVTVEGLHHWYRGECRAKDIKPLSGNRLNKELRRAGLYIRGRDDRAGLDHRVVINGRKLPILTNFNADDEAEPTQAIRNALKNMNDLGFEGEPL